jgi:glycine betaine/choline ABC-type transport system substrate-binding protein
MVAVLLTLALGGCGSSSVNPSDVTLTVRPEGSPERKLLGQIYVQALRATGYKVKKAPVETFANSSGMEAVKAGKVSGYPEYLSTALFYDFGVEIEDIPTVTQAAYAQTKKDLEKKGLTALPPTPYGIENAVGMLRKTAEKRSLKKNSDLKGQAEEMTLKGPTYCHVSVECLAGIEQHYNTAFESISYERGLTPELTWWRPEPDWRYEVLEDGESDASILYTTDGRLATEGGKFVILEDDRHIFPASNIVWVTSPDVVDEAGPEYEKAIVRAQKGLTVKVMQELNAKLERGKRTPAEVAAEYLKSIHYTG